MRQRDDLSRIRIPAAQSQRKAFLENNVAPELAVPGNVGDAEASLGQRLEQLVIAQQRSRRQCEAGGVHTIRQAGDCRASALRRPGTPSGSCPGRRLFSQGPCGYPDRASG